jgi:hypothetical protein
VEGIGGCRGEGSIEKSWERKLTLLESWRNDHAKFGERGESSSGDLAVGEVGRWEH